MTLTAPIPVVRQNAVQVTLADLIRTGIHPVHHQARLHPTITFAPLDRKGCRVVVTLDTDRLREQIRTAQASVVRAIHRTLDSVAVPHDEGSIEWTLGRDEREWTLTGTWRPQ